MAENKNSYWGWEDIADLPEAIIFYGEMISKGYYHHEICKMLDSYFPRIDKITCKKIQFKAFKWLKSLATDIETKIYLAKSMVRLERICANEHEKTKNVLVADAQLTHLLGLADIQEKDGPEELAAKMRAFLIAAQESTNGTAFAAAEKAAEKAATAEKAAAVPTEKEVTEKETRVPSSQNAEEQESSVNLAAEISEAETKDETKSKPTPKAVKQDKEDEKAIEFILRVSRAARLKKSINALKEEGIKEDVDNKDEWDGEADA